MIGRQLAARLLDGGADVVSIDREPMPPGDWGDLRHIRGDLADMDLSVAADFGPEQIFHLAASFERSEETPEYWVPGWRDDVLASHRLADQVVRGTTTVSSFVFASSYLIYDPSEYLLSSPETEPVALSEETNVNPRNLCGAGKYYTERELDYLVATTRPDMHVTNARIFRVFGRGSRDVISRWVRSGLRGDPVEVYNRSNRFDYIFADDVADALIDLGSDLETHGTFNVGTGTATSVSRVLDHLVDLDVVDPGSIIDRGEDAPFEASVADVERLRDCVGWTPSTSVRGGIEQLIEHETNAALA